jgi:hypothetical protein
MPNVHLLAVLVAALVTFVIGGLWYSPLGFARSWQRHNALSDEVLGNNLVRVFGGALIAALVQSVTLAYLVRGTTTLSHGALVGFAVGAGAVAAGLTTTFLFERRSGTLTAIDAGYHVVSFTTMGAILGAWH